MRTQDLPIVDCLGTAAERGKAHGEALRAVITAKVERWQEAIGEAYGIPASIFLQRFLAGTDFRAAIARHTPELAEEVSGIAQGAGLSQETAYALQLMDEEWWFGRADAAHCSSLAVPPSAGRPSFVAQTMDLPHWHDGAQALLRLREADGESLVFTSAGMIGLMGVSARGIGVCVNTLSQLDVDPRGLPVAFVMRGALRRHSVDDAARFLQATPHASGQNYQLGDRNGVRTFECSAAGATEMRLEGGWSAHTNHPLVSADLREGVADHEDRHDSRARLESLRHDLSPARTGGLNSADIKVALSARRDGGPVSIVPKPGAGLMAPMTFGAVIYEIGETVGLSACAGPPAVESWQEIELPPA